MEEFYLQQNKSNKGCLRLIILLVVMVALAILVFFLLRNRAHRKAEAQYEQSINELASPAGAMPIPTIAPPPAPPTPARNNDRMTPPTPIPTPRVEPKPTVQFDPSKPDQGRALLPEAEKLFTEGDFTSLREVGYQILEKSADPTVRARTEDLLGQAHIKMVNTPYPMPEKVEHTVARGDTLGELAKKYGTTIELIQKANNIPGSTIRLDDRLRILTGKFAVLVDKSDNDLVLTLNGKFFKRYRVGTGQYAKTPTGEFHITDRVMQPVWWRPDGKRVPYGDPENLLGTHWLSLDIRGYGLHGTWDPDTIGKQASAGCVRLLNEDIGELYNLLPIGTPVVIQE